MKRIRHVSIYRQIDKTAKLRHIKVYAKYIYTIARGWIAKQIKDNAILGSTKNAGETKPGYSKIYVKNCYTIIRNSIERVCTARVLGGADDVEQVDSRPRTRAGTLREPRRIARSRPVELPAPIAPATPVPASSAPVTPLPATRKDTVLSDGDEEDEVPLITKTTKANAPRGLFTKARPIVTKFVPWKTDDTRAKLHFIKDYEIRTAGYIETERCTCFLLLIEDVSLRNRLEYVMNNGGGTWAEIRQQFLTQHNPMTVLMVRRAELRRLTLKSGESCSDFFDE